MIHSYLCGPNRERFEGSAQEMLAHLAELKEAGLVVLHEFEASTEEEFERKLADTKTRGAIDSQ